MASRISLPVGLHIDFVTPFSSSTTQELGPNGHLTQELYNREFIHQVSSLFSTEELLKLQEEIRNQIEDFITLAGHAPSHLDYTDYPWPTSVAVNNAGLLDAWKLAHPNGRAYPPAFDFDEGGITWTPMTAQEPQGAFDRIDFVYFSAGDGTTVEACTELDQHADSRPRAG